MRVHFIAIGGAAMHNLALALHAKGYEVTGSDDEIFEPSKSRLINKGLLPENEGWFPEKITPNIDAIILGMHARTDNPELLKAQELGLKIYSYPDYIYEQTKDKKRVVIAGSHGKTTITSMIMHVLKMCGKEFDYLVGAQIEGFETMVGLSDTAPFAIIEGDEYLASPIDRRPKFHIYKPHVAIISGIAWDHINVFPTFENYVDQFKIFIQLIEPGGTLIYCNEDYTLAKLVKADKSLIKKQAYLLPDHVIQDGITSLIKDNVIYAPLKVFGNHNLLNIQGARLVCAQLGITDEEFVAAISMFKGAAKRLELVFINEKTNIFKDFAHSPSKLLATTNAVKNQFPERKLIACMELHTFSSLNENFLGEYKNSMHLADEAYVYYNEHTIEHKKLKPITPQQVKDAFGTDNVTVINKTEDLIKVLQSKTWENSNLLMMSSGNFDGIKFEELAKTIGLEE